MKPAISTQGKVYRILVAGQNQPVIAESEPCITNLRRYDHGSQAPPTVALPVAQPDKILT